MIVLPLVENMLPIFLSQICKPRSEKNKLNGIEEVRFSAAIASDDHIVLRTEGFDFALISEAAKAGDDDLLYMHFALSSKQEVYLTF